jgi:glycosyltransferase involved in cell wall biosynthesis
VSEWITARIAESTMAGAPRSTVHNPSWSAEFFPVDRQAARARLGVPKNAFAVMFALPRTLEDSRKGTDLIITAARRLRDAGIFLLPSGITEQDAKMASAFDGLDGLPSAHLATPEALRDYYAVADVVWHPSRADTSSMVCLEAFGCGTTVIAADVGGVGEIVEHNQSGLLIPPNDADALERATRSLMGDRALRDRLRDGARVRAGAHSPKRFIEGYMAVYADVLQS